MKKDISIPEVKNVHIAAVKETNDHQEEVWNVYIVNNQNEMIDGVMVTSKGYSDDPKEAQVKTSVMRHAVGNVPARTAAKIELINEAVFSINNEYWVTFFEGDKLMDKKFIFGAHTVTEVLYEDVPVMNVKGVVIW